MVRVSSRLAAIFCGVITLLLSRVYRFPFRGFDAYTQTGTPWTAFYVALISVGALAILLALVPQRWITKPPEAGKRVGAGWPAPIKVLTAFAGCSYLVVVGMYFAPHGWNLSPNLVFSLCPACVLTITVDPSLATVVLGLAPLSAAVYGSLGAIFGFTALFLRTA